LSTVEGEFFLLDQDCRGHGGEHLVHRTEVELGVDPVRHVEALAGQSGRALVENLVPLGQKHGARKHLGVGHALHERLHFRTEAIECERLRGRQVAGRTGGHNLQSVDAIWGTGLGLDDERLPGFGQPIPYDGHGAIGLAAVGVVTDADELEAPALLSNLGEDLQVYLFGRIGLEGGCEVGLDERPRILGIVGVERLQQPTDVIADRTIGDSGHVLVGPLGRGRPK
jgi:hypothetical protein